MNQRYAVVFEKSRTGFSAYVPDLPGRIATGETLGKTCDLMTEAIALHIESLQRHGEPVSEPTSFAMELSA